VGACRHDSAYAVAAQICESLDSAIYWQKHSDAAELATIYDMQQKENTITRQQADIKQARLLAIGIILGLLSLFLIFYILYRRNTMHRLAEKNAELKLANARAKESSEMKSDFIKQISHEIRTPLNILSGFTQVLTSTGMDIDENTRSDINRQITENTNRITGLVNKMLALSDAGSKMVIEQNDDVSPLQIATQAASDAGINEAKRIVFDLQVDDEAKTIMLHTNLQQSVSALSLLLDNALKFTKQGRVTLRVAIQSLASEHNILFTVEDTGIGVPPEEAEHIFEEFVQLDNYYNGTGIGLTIARSIARRLGGDIVLDTSYTEGARFVMSLKA
jgi:signal transduction histidine kinase